MNRRSALNAALLIAAILSSAWLGQDSVLASRAASPTDYRRIVSASVVADSVLLELLGSDRIVAFTYYSATSRSDRARYATKQSVASIADLETIVALRPDIVVTHETGDRRSIDRLQSLGVRTLNLGDIGGADALLQDVEVLGRTFGVEKAAKKLAANFRSDIESIAEQIPTSQRQNAAFIVVVGRSYYGGTRGTSYHDILHYAGLNDIAEAHYTGSPSYTREQILRLDPEWIITADGGRKALCDQDILEGLRACGSEDRIVEVPDEWLSTADQNMLKAARLIHDRVYFRQ